MIHSNEVTEELETELARLRDKLAYLGAENAALHRDNARLDAELARMREGAIEGWVGQKCVQRYRNGKDWCVVMGRDDTREDYDVRAVLILIPRDFANHSGRISPWDTEE